MDYTSIIQDIRTLAKGGNCNSDLADFILSHRCYYLLAKSPNHMDQIKSLTSLNAIAISQRFKAFAPVAQELVGIPYTHVKGALLSSHIYGSTAYRHSGDIDILVSPKHLDEVKSVLKNNGFIQGKIVNNQIVPYTRKEIIFQSSFSHQVAAFVKATGNKLCPFINIDVNTDIMWGESGLKIDMDEFLTHTRNEAVCSVEVKALQPVWEFIALCLHHYKDMNSVYLLAEKGLRLSELCDIYFYLKNIAPDAKEIAETSRKYNVDEFVYYVIYYANRIFSDEHLEKYLKALYSKEADTMLNTYGLNANERKAWNVPFEERLLDKSFKEKFYNSLSEEELKKVQLNREFM